MLFSNVKPGDRVEWMTVNGERVGTVASVSRMGVLVNADRGRQVLLSTRESMAANREDRDRRYKEIITTKRYTK